MYALYLARERYALRRERLYRDRLNRLEKYDDFEIKRLFRFERENILRITNELKGVIEHPSMRNKALSPLHQVCVALRFFATGCMQSSIASWINIDPSTVSRCVHRVTSAILECNRDAFRINNNVVRRGVFENFGLPSIIGAIDCTHIGIIDPPANMHPDEYINRKNYHSINVQAVCDSDCVFIDIDAPWPGSVHDSRIFKNSSLYRKLIGGEIQGSLIDDNGYPLQHICLVPFLRPTNGAEEQYNMVHKKAKCTIERSFGQLKMRFRCLQGKLRIKLERVPTISNQLHLA